MPKYITGLCKTFMICPEIDTLFFFPFLKISRSEFRIQDLISRLTVNQNAISIYQNLSLGVGDHKTSQILKIEALTIVYNGSLNTLRFF